MEHVCKSNANKKLNIVVHRCVSTFTADQQTSLLETAKNIASYECFLHLFEQVTVVSQDYSMVLPETCFIVSRSTK